MKISVYRGQGNPPFYFSDIWQCAAEISAIATMDVSGKAHKNKPSIEPPVF